MTAEKKTIVYDSLLKVEAYRFEGMVRGFPAHFHEHYTVGLMNGGERRLICGNSEYGLRVGDMVLFNPHDSHACANSDGCMDFSGINIPEQIMTELAAEITGKSVPPRFRENVFRSAEVRACFAELHEIITRGNGEPESEEKLLLLISMLIGNYAAPFDTVVPDCGEEIERVCEYMKRNYSSRITLEQLCRCAGLSRSTLLRAFTREMGITPYGYLENIRICEAKRLLESGIPPAEAAVGTGFYDQSHFTTYFTRFIGLPPGEYQARAGNREIPKKQTGGSHEKQ